MATFDLFAFLLLTRENIFMFTVPLCLCFGDLPVYALVLYFLWSYSSSPYWCANTLYIENINELSSISCSFDSSSESCKFLTWLLSSPSSILIIVSLMKYRNISWSLLTSLCQILPEADCVIQHVRFLSQLCSYLYFCRVHPPSRILPPRRRGRRVRLMFEDRCVPSTAVDALLSSMSTLNSAEDWEALPPSFMDVGSPFLLEVWLPVCHLI